MFVNVRRDRTNTGATIVTSAVSEHTRAVDSAQKKRGPAVKRQPDPPKYGGDLLSQLVCQYHRRARA